MFPYKYTTDAASKVTFHYDPVEYRAWYKSGDTGQLLVSIEGLMYTYWIMGNGVKYTIHVKHFPPWDGPVQPPEYYLKENVEKRMADFWANQRIQIIN
jgi:hypothetical protein